MSIERLKGFLENEAHSCSMDFECMTLVYVYGMCGCTMLLNSIIVAMDEIKEMFHY